MSKSIPTRIVVTGPRSWRDPSPISAALKRLAAWRPGAVIVHGGATGADTLAASVAASLGLAVQLAPAQWSVCCCGRNCISRGVAPIGARGPYCPAAGPARNRAMLSLPGVVGVLACVPPCGLCGQRGCCSGTASCVAAARSLGLPVWAVYSGPDRAPTASNGPRVHSRRTGAPPPPDGALYVGRPSAWGNPYHGPDRSENIAAFRSYATARATRDPSWLAPLRGRHLVCWCHPLPCHADVLIELANRPQHAPANHDRKPAPRTPQPSESMADALASTGLSLAADQLLRDRWDDGLHTAVNHLVYDPISGEDRFVRGDDGTPVFSDQLYEDVELCEADYSTKQMHWRHLPEWELRPETRSEDTQLLDAPFTGAACSTRGRDLGAKQTSGSITAWHFAIERNLERDARLEALALRQLEYSARKAFGTPLTLTRPAVGAEPTQARGRVRLGEPAEPITSFRDTHSFLSNFYPSPITIDGRTYPTAEHAYQSMKAATPEAHERIRQAATPGQAKRLGRATLIRSNWDPIATMRTVLQAKYSDPSLAALLLATHERQIVEANTWGDTIWGTCNGSGRNTLGLLLMEIRDTIRQPNTYSGAPAA